jgi:hypothetical protein
VGQSPTLSPMGADLRRFLPLTGSLALAEYTSNGQVGGLKHYAARHLDSRPSVGEMSVGNLNTMKET